MNDYPENLNIVMFNNYFQHIISELPNIPEEQLDIILDFKSSLIEDKFYQYVIDNYKDFSLKVLSFASNFTIEELLESINKIKTTYIN